MENLDLLIAKFKEVKKELESDAPFDDTLEKYISPFYMFGSSKKGKQVEAAKPAAAPAKPKLTGSDKIAAVSKETIHPTSVVSEDRKRAASMGAPSNPTSANKPAPAAPKLTGLDRIRAESQKPITATTVKKDEDDIEKGEKVPAAHGNYTIQPHGAGGHLVAYMPHGDSTAQTLHAAPGTNIHPSIQHAKAAIQAHSAQVAPAMKSEGLEKGLFSSAESAKKPFTPSFKGHSAALGVGAKTNVKGVTTERSFDPLKQQTSQKKFINMPFGKTVNGSYGPQANQSGMAMSRDEKLTLNKGGQWGLEKNLQDAIKQLKSSTKITGAMNSMRSANPGMPKSAAAPVVKDETGEPKGTVAKSECGKCHADPCQCQSTGINVDKVDGGDMSPGSGV